MHPGRIGSRFAAAATAADVAGSSGRKLDGLNLLGLFAESNVGDVVAGIVEEFHREALKGGFKTGSDAEPRP
jgi:hypothetical protein